MVSSALSNIRPTAKINDMYHLQVKELKDRLTQAGIAFRRTDLKYNLQARWAMFNLGLVEAGGVPDKVLLSKITRWCKMLVKDQLKELEEKGLNIMGNKWDHVEVLTRAELDDGEAAMARLRLDNHVSAVEPPLRRDRYPDRSVVDLLLASIYADVDKKRSAALLPGCPVSSKAKLRQRLRIICRVLNSSTLTSTLRPPLSRSAKLLSWICSQYGRDIVPAKGDLFISEMPASFHQFILAKPTQALQDRFDIELAADSFRSCVLFHGTPMKNLRSIICNGFQPCKYDIRFGLGVFMANHPYSCYGYAFKDDDNVGLDSPFDKHNVLLGCQVTGTGRRVRDDYTSEPGVHVIKRLSSIMIRYIFLLSELDHQEITDKTPIPPPDVPLLRSEILGKFDSIRSRKF